MVIMIGNQKPQVSNLYFKIILKLFIEEIPFTVASPVCMGSTRLGGFSQEDCQ